MLTAHVKGRHLRISHLGFLHRYGGPGSRDDVLEPSVYDLARESARVEGRAGSRGKEQFGSQLGDSKPIRIDQ